MTGRTDTRCFASRPIDPESWTWATEVQPDSAAATGPVVYPIKNIATGLGGQAAIFAFRPGVSVTDVPRNLHATGSRHALPTKGNVI